MKPMYYKEVSVKDELPDRQTTHFVIKHDQISDSTYKEVDRSAINFTGKMIFTKSDAYSKVTHWLKPTSEYDGAKDDLKFLKKMRKKTQLLINGRYDITVVEYLDKMIEDWIDELENR